MPPEIQRIADNFLHNPVRVEVSKPATAATTITQLQIAVGREGHEKRDTLRRVIRAAENFKNAIIFCNRKREVAQLHKSLVSHGFNAVALHGDLDQTSRTAALEAFRKGDAKLLIASDVAARGLDIPAVSHVFNFDVPHHADDYVHRIGRTGRAGLTGTAITLVAPIDSKSVAAIEKLMNMQIPWMGEPAKADGAEASEPRQDRGNRRPQGERSEGRSARGGRSRGGRNRQPRQESAHQAAHDLAPAQAEPPRSEQVQQPRARQEQKPARNGSGQSHRQPVAVEAQESDGSHLPAFLLRPVTIKA
jgi:superfamily II DNA/RNA helicase